jgi:integrase
LLNRRRGEIASGRYCPDADRVTFEDLTQIIEADYRLQGRRSMPRLQLSLHNLREHFGDERAVQITADRLTTYADARRAEGAALASISAELAALRRAFNLAVRAGRLQSRPYFPTLRVSNARQGFLQEADFHAIVAELPEYLRAPLTFGWLTGWRVRSEVLPMTWAQVDLEAGTARLEQGSTKSGEGREFPIRALPELEQLLLRQREHVRALERKLGSIIVNVFVNNQGRPIMDYAKAWRGACKRAKLPGTLVHDMRRSAVRRLERAGVSRSVAMKLVGHRTESIYRATPSSPSATWPKASPSWPHSAPPSRRRSALSSLSGRPSDLCVGDLLRHVRVELGLSEVALATMAQVLGVTADQLVAMEAPGEVVPNIFLDRALDYIGELEWKDEE